MRIDMVKKKNKGGSLTAFLAPSRITESKKLAYMVVVCDASDGLCILSMTAVLT